MTLGRDLTNRLLIGSLILVIIALLLDEFGRSLEPMIKRYRSRLGPSRLPWQVFLPLFAGVGLAILMWGSTLIQVYVMVVGVLVTWYRIRRAKEREQLLESRQVFDLVLAFRGEYQLQPSVFSTLDRIKDRVEQPLRGLVEVLIKSFYLTDSPERAFKELRERTDNVYINQFAYILEMSESASADAVVKALDNLVARLQSHDELRRESESSLTSITGQTSVLQRIAAAIVVAVGLIPGLRAPYSSTMGQLVYIIFLSVILGGSYYIDREIGKLMERIS